MQPSDWIALAAIGATVAAGWIVHLDRSSDRSHAEKLARDQRQQDRLASTYREAVLMVLQVEQAIRTTLPIWSVTGQEPYPGPTQEDQLAMQAKLSTFGSPEMLTLYESAAKVAREFLVAVTIVRGGEVTGTAPPGTQGNMSGRELVEAKRQAFIDARKALEQRANTELAK
jgi:hypothetical protein